MIDLDYIKGFYPAQLTSNKSFEKHLVKEYVELMALDFLATTSYIKKLRFIGGTNLRLIKGIDRFSEDLDFDCKDMTAEEFAEMTDALIAFCRKSGLEVEARDKDSSRLTAYRRNIHFPGLLFNLGLTGHREQRFLLKMEAQDQGIDYETQMATIARCGFTFQIPTPPDAVLLSMKLSALLSRAKGRDFYDTMFLWQQTEPDYTFLSARVGISDKSSLIQSLSDKIATIDLAIKAKDFVQLLFNPANAQRILLFPDFLATRNRLCIEM